ncbi:DUF7524 family protein [Halovenus halobia]|uniref:DUF7524 family protein n=1 Tax=Halovenus halobia TaxID=3396622 RepID=UPI003F556FAF
MPDTLPVHVSRESLHSLEVPASYETTGTFDIRLINHAESLHVHVHLDDPLSEVARLDAGNHYVETESERYVRVTVDTDRLDGEDQLGKLKVATAYGSETRWVDVTVSEPEPEANNVAVDESLATPQPRTDDEASIPPVVPVLAVGGLALLLFAVAAVFLEGTAMWLGALVLAGGVLTASFFLLRD